MARPPDSKRPPAGSDTQSATGDLASRIRRAQADERATSAAARTSQFEMSGVGRAYRLAAEFVAAIVVGAAIGFGIDWVFKTQPWGLVIFLLLGFAAGILNVVRATAEMNARTAVPPDTPALRDDEDD